MYVRLQAGADSAWSFVALRILSVPLSGNVQRTTSSPNSRGKSTNDELRGRVIDYLNNVVREKKRAEMKVKSIKSRIARVRDCITPYHCPCFAYRGFILQFCVWLANNWESTSLDACKEETS